MSNKSVEERCRQNKCRKKGVEQNGVNTKCRNTSVKGVEHKRCGTKNKCQTKSAELQNMVEMRRCRRQGVWGLRFGALGSGGLVLVARGLWVGGECLEPRVVVVGGCRSGVSGPSLGWCLAPMNPV